MVVKPARKEFLGGPMSPDSHHSSFRHRTRIDPKGRALVSHKLNFNQIESPIGSGAPQ
jgi:hypothetical protein